MVVHIIASSILTGVEAMAENVSPIPKDAREFKIHFQSAAVKQINDDQLRGAYKTGETVTWLPLLPGSPAHSISLAKLQFHFSKRTASPEVQNRYRNDIDPNGQMLVEIHPATGMLTLYSNYPGKQSKYTGF